MHRVASLWRSFIYYVHANVGDLYSCLTRNFIIKSETRLARIFNRRWKVKLSAKKNGNLNSLGALQCTFVYDTNGMILYPWKTCLCRRKKISLIQDNICRLSRNQKLLNMYFASARQAIMEAEEYANLIQQPSLLNSYST